MPILSEISGIGLEVNDHETSSYYNSDAVHSRKRIFQAFPTLT